MRVKSFKATRLRTFSYFLATGGTFYLVDCLVSFTEHLELPWFETGIYAGGAAGFFLSIGFIVIAFGYLILGKDK
jgi:hypothetical protein